MLGLTSLLDTLPKAMSGGQRQRVALGRAMVRESAVFLLDEPLSNLDAKLRNSVRSDITRLHRKLGTTMIYVTHDQVEAMTLGHRIVLLKDGVIQQIDTPMVLYDHPANLFVAGFLGNPAMNMLSGRLEVVAGGMELHLVSGERVMFAGAIPKSVWFGRDVVLGVRPEHIRPAGLGEPVALEATIEALEPVGNEVFYICAVVPWHSFCGCRLRSCQGSASHCRWRCSLIGYICLTRFLVNVWPVIKVLQCVA